MRGVSAGIVLVALGCGPATGSRPPQAEPSVRAPVGAAEVPLPWLVGRWVATDGSGIEHWSAAGDALFGVSFTATATTAAAFEVMIVAVADGSARLTAMPGGGDGAVFRLTGGTATGATFTNPEHDFPRTITYERAGDELTAKVEGDDPAAALGFRWRLGPAGRDPELELADRDFAAAVAERRLDAWVDAFAPGGAMWRPGRGRIDAPGGVREVMAPAFADPAFRFEWEPTASGRSPAGDLGYTVGRYRILSVQPSGLRAERERGAYVTVWQRQPDGRWQVLFDTGDPQAAS